MQILKAVVIVMGVLIVAGFTVIATTIYKRAGQRAETSAGAEGKPAGRAAPLPFTARQLVIPPGSAVRHVTAADERLIVWLSDSGGTQRIMVLDLGTGEELGTFEIKESP